jgi:hypothetical protein
MTAERSQAYGRVMRLLADVGAAKLQPREQELVREAADAMLFTTDYDSDAHAQMAMGALQELAEALVESERWMFATADRMLRDIEDCGPIELVDTSDALALAA